MVDIAYRPDMKTNATEVTLVDGSNSTKMDSVENVMAKVNEMQNLSLYTAGVKKLRAGQVSKFTLLDPKQNTARYTLSIHDSTSPTILSQNTCSIFIIPPGH